MTEGVKIALITGGFTLAAIFVRWVVSVLPKAGARQTELSQIKADLRLLTDYVHDLRADVVELGGTPRDWPEGLTK